MSGYYLRSSETRSDELRGQMNVGNDENSTNRRIVNELFNLAYEHVNVNASVIISVLFNIFEFIFFVLFDINFQNHSLHGYREFVFFFAKSYNSHFMNLFQKQTICRSECL